MNTFSLPKTQHLVVFQEVIRSGSIGAGAKALGLTQPAVSKIIGDMESYFGSELIVRRNTGVSLTEAGQVFLNWSETITREMKNMVNEMNALTNSTVVDVSFGFPSLVGFTFMSEMVHQFKMTFPKARVSMYEAQLSAFLPAIRDGRLDFAIGTLSDEMKLQDLHVEPLFESEFVLVAFVTIPIKEALPVARYAAVWSKNYRLKTAAASLVEMAKQYSSGQGNRHWQPIEIA